MRRSRPDVKRVPSGSPPEGKQLSAVRQIPSVDRILSSSEIEPIIAAHGRAATKLAVRSALERLRRNPAGRFDLHGLASDVAEQLAHRRARSLRPVINGTGVLIHTNLGRATVSEEVLGEARELLTSYSNLEFDLASGERGRRDDHLTSVCRELYGAEAALLVNNNAGAVLLLLAATAAGREVVVSRGELVEIGGSFRVPDVITQGGATLREVGTTNKTRASDYAAGCSRRTGALLRVHRSNFELVGFTESPTVEELVEVARAKRRPLFIDEGSGRTVDLAPYGLSRKPLVRELLEQGADVVTCSTDKLIGATQGGLILGRAETVAACARHPLMRALRAGKESYGVIDATLRAFLSQRHEETIPLYRMLSRSVEELRRRAEAVAAAVSAESVTVVDLRSVVGGGTTPTETVGSSGVAIDGASPDELALRLRHAAVPIVSRIEEGRVLLDLRTVAPEDDEYIAKTLAAVVAS